MDALDRALFKARRVDNGEWVEGFVFEYHEVGTCIGTEPLSANGYGEIYSDCYDVVDPATLCQYIQKEDKHDTKIFDGDIVQTKYGRLCRVVWFEPKACWDLTPINTPENIDLKAPDKWDMWHRYNLEIIGNIYNKEC